MAGKTKSKDRRCCSIENDRLAAELDTSDQLFKTASEWHRCARVIAQRSGQRAQQCMLQD
jgi:hypothetical protein